MQRISPCIWFVRNAEEAVKLYTSVIQNSKIGKISRYGDAGAEVSGMPKGSVLTIDFQLAGLSVQALNGGPYYEHTSSVSLFLTCGSREDVDRIYTALSEGGKTLLELGEYPFSPRYAFFQDRFGVHWQLFLEKGAQQKLTPSIIFGREKNAAGAKAVDFYLSLFQNSRKIMDVRYGKNEGGAEGSVMHARLNLDGSDLIIMDSGHSENMPITGALSLMITCQDQAEVDYFWNAIGKSGKEIQCGWIEDQFGISWQVVPAGIEDLVMGPDPIKAERAMKAMLQMKKLDINKLRQAYQG